MVPSRNLRHCAPVSADLWSGGESGRGEASIAGSLTDRVEEQCEDLHRVDKAVETVQGHEHARPLPRFVSAIAPVHGKDIRVP